MESNDIGKRIAILRKQKGWSQMELAEKLNVTDKAVSKWENGGMPSIDLLPKLSEIFNVTIDHLILGDKENEKKSQDSEIKKDNKETEVAQDEFSVEGLGIEDIKLMEAKRDANKPKEDKKISSAKAMFDAMFEE